VKRLSILLLLLFIVSCSNLYKKGENYLKQGEYDRAIEEYKEIVEKFPDDWKAYYGLGQAYRGKQKFLKAIYYYNKALELRPGWEAPKKAKRSTIEERGDYYLNKKRYSTALEIFSGLAEKEPNNVNLHVKKGKIYESKKDFDKALEYYKKLQDKFPGNKKISDAVKRLEERNTNYKEYFSKAENYYKRANFEKSAEFYEKALLERPDKKDAEYGMRMSKGRSLLIEFYKSMKIFKAWDAIEQFILASRIFPDRAAPHYFLGVAHHKKDKSDYDTPIEHFKKALEIDPDFKYAKECRKKMNELIKLKKFWGK